MNPMIFSPEAAQDLDDIFDYIARANPASAARVIQKIERACRTLAQFPAMGAERNDLQPGLRCFLSGKYVICYRVAGNGIEIARIVHGSRDIQSLFDTP